MIKVNLMDYHEDLELIAKGLSPVNYIYTDYGPEGPRADQAVAPVPAAARTKAAATARKRPSHIYQLSHAAHQALVRAKETIAELRPLEKSPSGSVAVEFLVWWFEQTQEHAKAMDFQPVTRIGNSQGTVNDSTLRPKHIREQAQHDAKQAGEKPIDQITAKRKLR
jgi:hypothetical protein